MNDSLRQTMVETISQVFEMMFFTALEPLAAVPPEEEWGGETSYIEAAVTIDPEKKRAVRFYFSRRLARRLAVNFLGIEEEALQERQIIDTVGETINMAVGSLLGKIDPDAACCTLGIPETRELPDFSPERIAAEPEVVVFNSESGLLWLTCGALTICGGVQGCPPAS